MSINFFYFTRFFWSVLLILKIKCLLPSNRALVRSMSEILFLCGRSERAVIVSLNILNGDFVKSANRTEDEVHFIIFNKLHVTFLFGSLFQLEQPLLFLIKASCAKYGYNYLSEMVQ